ncbi:MAG: HlyD family secretion protein [Bryobacteraceae bacterium]
MDSNSEKSKKSSFRRGVKVAIWVVAAAGIAIAVSSPISQTAIERKELRAETILPASIRPHTFATINSEFAGQIAELHVSPGTKVNSGDPLITLLNADLQMEYERAKLHYETVQQRLDHRGASSDANQSQAAIGGLQAAKERLAGFSLDETKNAHDAAVAKVRELQKLVQQQLATELELDEARKAEEAGLRDLRAEREHLSRLNEEVQVAKIRVAATGQLSPLAGDALNLNIELREAAEALRIAAARRDSQRILARTSGTVLRTMVNAGDEIPSDVPLLQLGQLDQLDFDVPVGADLAQRIKVGQKVNVRVPTDPPTQMSAPVSAILLIATQDQSAYTVRITMRNPSPNAVLVGLAGEVEFPHAEASWRALRF